jgi:hypothetical protein
VYEYEVQDRAEQDRSLEAVEIGFGGYGKLAALVLAAHVIGHSQVGCEPRRQVQVRVRINGATGRPALQTT